MNEKKKVTIYLNESLVKKLKMNAIEKDMTLSALIENIARKELEQVIKKKTAQK